MGGLQKIVPWVIMTGMFFIMLAACASEKPYPDTGTGKTSGTAEKALVVKKNSWRGAVIGGALGEIVEGNVTEISARATREAAKANKPVAYQSSDGFQRVEAHPLEKGPTPQCGQVREQIYQEGKLLRDEIQEVCQ